MKRFFLLLTGTLLASAFVAPSQSWFFNWDGTADITCAPTTEGNNAYFQGAAANSSFYWEIVDNGAGGKAWREVVTGATGYRCYGYGSRPELYRGPCDTFGMENFRSDHNAFTFAFRVKAENCTSTSNVRFWNCEFETTVPDPFWPTSYDPFYTFRVEFSLRKDSSSSDIWLTDFRSGQDLVKLKVGTTTNWHTVWGTCELPPYPYATSNSVYRLWIDGAEVAWNDRDKGGWSDSEFGFTPTSGANATLALDYLCYTYGAYQPGAIAIPSERTLAPTNGITGLKGYADATPVSLTNKVVAFIGTDSISMKYYYISEPDGSDGIKVRHQTGQSPKNAGGSAVTLAVGDIVSVKGGLSSAECEKQISAYEIVRASTGSSLAYPGTVSATDVAKSYNLALLTDQPAQLLVAAENGTVTSIISTNKIVSSGKAWSINQWKNMTAFLPGTAFHPDLYYNIVSNSTDTLTISHRTIRTDFNVCPNIVTDGVKVADQFRFVGGQVTGPRLDGKRVRTTGAVIAVNSSQGYFDIDDGTVPAEMNTLQDIWDTMNYGSSWTAPDGLRVSWAGTMPTVGSQVALEGCVGAARKKLQVSTTINSSPRDEVKIDKTYPLILADGWVPFTDPPAAFAVTGGGAYCSGGSGVAVGLSGSETGVNYQLYRDGTTAVGSPVAGTGSALNFGNQTVAGTYTVKGTRTGCTTGCTLDMSGSAVVTVNPVAAVDAGPDQVVCNDSPTVTLAGAIGGAATSGTWSGGAGTFTPDNTTLNATYTPTAGEITAGSVTLTLATDDPAGPCGAVSDAMVITINPVATVNAGADQTVCASSPVVTLAGAIGGAAASGTWSGGAGTFTPDNTTLDATYTPTAGEITAGTVTLTLATDDPAGPCGAVSDAVVITINPVGTVNAGADQTVCA
ncbi:MAG: hypothetical protein NT167_11680, partial [Verrucomicrobia bacterium]|nr:hypothetical protein [Verrucomicrobiota bacterium]